MRLILATDAAVPEAATRSLAASLVRAGWQVDERPLDSLAPEDGDVIAVVADSPLVPAVEELLSRSGTPMLLLGPTLAAWRGSELVATGAGVLGGERTPVHEVRVRPGADGGEVSRRLAGDVLVRDAVTLVDKVYDDVEVLLTANVARVDHPVATLRRGAVPVATCSLGTALDALADPAVQYLVHRVLRATCGVTDGPALRVGLLGYGAIGAEHALAISAVDGLELTAVCDRDPTRVAAARTIAPDLTAAADADQLVAADDVDLVVVSTPPNAHATWALKALAEGKHVVVEKPFALSTDEADGILAAAAHAGRTVVCYQNRRWDTDYRALRAAVRAGSVGEVFHVETFVGGYGHPCNYWHSDAEVSGGAAFDWGSHYVDWLLDLLPLPVESVVGSEHKRVWHDVTNADHSRIQVRFAGGIEAEFVHSDVAAALKPKFYVLGTAGAIRGDWRDARVVGRNAIGTLTEDVLAPADSPAELALHDPSGGVTRLALPAPLPQPFHRELADALLGGWPASVDAAQSRRVVSVLEAAGLSAREGSRPVVPA
jgi:scyllo-inositol 2-dehydrogenase (NADP+)